MFFSSEDDEQDFLTHGGTKLASVFGMDKANNQGGNESLTYTAPKQPKKKDGGADGSAAATAVTFATVVQAYKFVDNQYASQGKVGAAILANHQGSDYHILLYINKQQQLTNVKILPTFTFNIQQNNYANFYDEARTNWSVMFNNSQDAEKFAKEVGLAKALASGGRLESVVQQELQVGEGGGLEAGDSVEVKYTGWLMTNNTFGQVFDSNASSDKLFRFKLGKGKVIKGWDTGMLGMRKGGKRFLVIPPHVGYGSQGLGDRIPPNSTLIFEVEVLRVKLQKGESTPEQVVHTTVPSPGPAVILADVPFVDHDETVKDRSRSITEQLTHAPASDKAKLISRMAKMGQPMLPTMLGGIPTQQDSEDEMTPTQPTISKPPLAAKPQAFPQPHHTQPHLMQPTFQQHIPMAEQPMAQTPPYMQQMVQPPGMGGMPVFTAPVSQPAFLQNLPGSQQLSVYQPPPSLLQQQQQALLAMQQQQQQQQMQGFPLPSQTAGLMGQPAHMAANPAGPLFASSAADPMTPILLTETRQQSTEVRLTVSKMSDKVDKILEKVESLNNGVMQLQSLPAPTMETSILLHNISRIIQENERLKKDVFERGEKIESQNEKIAELLQKNQRFVEKSNFMLEERNEGYKMTANQAQGRILALEQEKVQMATELSSASSRLASLQLELGELRKTEGELRQRLQSNTSSSTEQREELERLRLQRAEDEKKLVDLNNLLREEKTARKQTEGQLTAMQEEMADLRTTSSNQERALNERKRKAVEEKKKLEEEIEEIKAGYEQDLQILREKLKKQRATTDVETADRVNKLEEELASEWQSKCDKLLAAANDKHERQLATVREDLKEAQDKASTLEAKVQELRASGSSTDIKMAQLNQQLEENLTFKEKYENLRIQATTMKQKYEDRISELEDEAETLTTRIKDLQQQLLQTRQQVQLQQEQLQQQQEQLQEQQQRLLQVASAAGSGGGDVAAEVKKIMNSVFQSLRKEFEADETYLGTEIMATVLNVIKETTLKLVQQQSPASAQNDPDEEEESEDEEDEDEEEEEEESELVAVEERFVESTVSVTATLAASPPLIQQTSVTSEDVEKSMSPTTYPVTGDKGNPYYSRELDADADDNSPESPEGSFQSVNSNLDILGDSGEANIAKAGDQDAQNQTLHGDSEEETKEEKNEGEEKKETNPQLQTSTQKKPEENQTFQADPDAPAEQEPTTMSDDDDDDILKEVLEPSSAKDPTPVTSRSKEVEKDPLSVDIETLEPAMETVHQQPKETTVKPRASSNASSEDNRERTGSASVLPALVSREPPPLFDDDDDDSPLFGADSTVSDTFGSHFLPTNNGDDSKKAPEKKPITTSKLPSKADLSIDDDTKPKPPPPLFGDDDDDDLDWLS